MVQERIDDWWEYAKESPYFKEYFQKQWEIYAKTREKAKDLEKNITYRNILFCTMAIAAVFLLIYWGVQGYFMKGLFSVLAALGIGAAISLLLRKGMIWIQKKR